ncbi:glycosyltransferase family 2 protein [Diaphorobacter sp. HDW4A]|uniref:glycosyltransferase family 2 protein n=1 Tax=Diaphorobacter sp. HDW4A TaxID=2714924 RepID=UPI001409EE65|nr:glycosyltransferase family 2 protein [Diaphorobacter sp. HDW4A]QIL82850.1 glycosyltransferase family 2 protein [Diaphorobacter sp. HDW4A]
MTQHPQQLPSIPPPWLSVLVPAYNVEPYLEECLASVMEQTADLPGVEVLVRNDCSTDGTGALMQRLAERWPGRLTLMENERNWGLSATRNAMLDAARGEYLWFIDSDDKILPGSMAALHDIVATHSPDVVLCDFAVWREKPRLKHRLRGERHRRTFAGAARTLLTDRCDALADVLMPGELHAWSKITRRALWGRDLHFPVGQCYEDMTSMPLVMLRAASFYYADEPWIAYRQRSTSVLANPNLSKALDQSMALKEFHMALQTSGCADHARLQLALAHQNARNFIGSMRFVDAMDDLNPKKREAVQRIRANFLAASPLSPEALCKAYSARGWWLRRSKLQRWLKASETA